MFLRFGDSWTPEKRCKRLLELVLFFILYWTLFLAIFGPHFFPPNCSNFKSMNKVQVHLGISLFCGALHVPFGWFLGPPEVVLGASQSRKVELFSFLKIKLFANAGFQYFETLDGLLGSILAPLRPILGPIWPREVAPKQSGSCSKTCVRQQDTL